jgi:alanine racemase
VIDDKWIEIDINAVKYNLKVVRSLLNQQTRLIAVVKANGYGHGTCMVAGILADCGVDFFAVTFLEEALELRKAGIKGNILVFSPLIDEEKIITAVKEKLTLTITSPYDGELIDNVTRANKLPVTVHIKIDTGLGRFGLNLEEALQICHSLKQNPSIYMEGIYTHMSEGAAKRPEYTRNQFYLFMQVVEALKQEGFRFSLRHCANSAVLLKYPEMQLDAVRVGTLLAGQLPVGAFVFREKLIEPFKFKTRIISVRTKPKGSFLGYYRTYRLKRPAKIVVIPVGYTDGLVLDIANRPIGFMDLLRIIARKIAGYLDLPRFNNRVLINGKPYPVRGKVFMQSALIELADNIEVHIGDEVEVPIKKTLANPQIKRVYVNRRESQDDIEFRGLMEE